MSDLISRQAAINALVEELAYKPEGYWDSGLNRYDVEVVLNQQPSADAVEVVRCRDCKHNPNDTWFECPIANLPYKEDRWCWKGERKDD